MEQDQIIKKRQYLIYAVLFVIILILIGITATYAAFKAQTTNDFGTTALTAATDCVNISYSETDTIDLDYNYPVTDDYAVNNVKPVTITVTNNCSGNIANINYALTITSLSNETEDYISEDKIRTSVKRAIGNETESTILKAGYVSNLISLTSGDNYINLNKDLDSRSNANTYTNRDSYIIDTSNVASGETNTYKVYLWVDYYEGDAEAYNGAEHDESYDNTTQNKKFAAAISLIVNPAGGVK